MTNRKLLLLVALIFSAFQIGCSGPTRVDAVSLASAYSAYEDCQIELARYGREYECDGVSSSYNTNTGRYSTMSYSDYNNRNAYSSGYNQNYYDYLYGQQPYFRYYLAKADLEAVQDMEQQWKQLASENEEQIP